MDKPTKYKEYIPGKYDDIIHLSRPNTHRARMSLGDRAKIFSPFAALRGYEGTVDEQNRHRVNKIILTEETQAQVDAGLRALKKGSTAAVTYFRSDVGPDGMGGKAEGFYENVTGTVDRIDPIESLLRLDTGAELPLEIPFWDILRVEGVAIEK